MKKFILLMCLLCLFSLSFVSSANVYQISDYNFGSGENVTMRSYGVALEQNHADSDPNLVGWWQFTDDATDSSGNGNDGSVTGATHNFSWYEFDGAGDRITANKVSGVVRGLNFSISLWIKVKNDSGGAHIFSHYHNGTEQLAIGVRETGRVDGAFYNGSSGGYFLLTTSQDSVGKFDEWYYVSYVAYDNLTAKLYINGVSQTGEGNMGGALGGELTIGARGDLGTYFNGSIDEVAIYNRSLNSTEITALYNKGLFKHSPEYGNYTSGILDAGQNVNWTNINWTFSNSTAKQNVTLKARTGEIAKPDFADSSLVSMWSLNQTDTNGTKTLAIDSMGRNNGTALGGMEVGTANGIFQGENATGFDGVDDYILASSDQTLIFSNETDFTISGWMKTYSLANKIYLIGEQFYKYSSISLYVAEDGQPFCRVHWNSGSSTTSVKSVGSVGEIGINNWYFYSCSVRFNGSATSYNVTLSVNGIEKTTSSESNNSIQYSSTRPVEIGRGEYNHIHYFLNGSIAYVSIFNKSLTSDEIINWSTYTGELLISQGETLDLPVNRYLQYQAKLQTNDTKYTPILTDVQAVYNEENSPTYSTNSTNSTYASQSILHSLNWLDDEGLSGYIFQFCAGTWNGTDCTGNTSEICYQETANISTSCGGLSTGSYDFSGTWIDGGRDNFYDGNWSSAGWGLAGNTGIVEITYKKPTGAIQATTKWQVKDETGTTNLTIPSECWDYNATDLLLKAYSSDGGGFEYWQCYNSTWKTLRSSAIGAKLYEEAMYWNISSSGGWENDTFVQMSGVNNWSNVTKEINSTVGIDYAWCVYSNDTSNNWNNSCANPFTYTSTSSDSVAPRINIIYPTNTNYNSVTQLNYSVVETNLDSCWYSTNNSVNSSAVTSGNNFTITASSGSNTWTVYCNDTNSNENQTSITFYVLDDIEILFNPLAVYTNSLWMLTFSLDGASNTAYDDSCGTLALPTDSINTLRNSSYALSWSGQNSHLGNSEKRVFSIFNFPRFFYDTYRVFIRLNTTSNAVTSFNLNLTEVLNRTGISTGINESTYRMYRINENGGVYNDTGICYEQPVFIE